MSSGLWTEAAAVLLVAFLAEGIVAVQPKNNVISYPLIPHSVEQARRQLYSSDSNNNNGRRLNRHRRALSDDPDQLSALFQGYGTHYVDLWCGSPTAQRQTVIVDTGSGVTAFPCSTCVHCGVPDHHIDALFQEDQSNTYQIVRCSGPHDCTSHHSSCHKDHCVISQGYSEGSRYDAVEAIDRCYIGGSHEQALVLPSEQDTDDSATKKEAIDPTRASQLAFDLDFGCETVVTNLFETQLADGILGMNNGSGPFWKQMSQAGKLSQDQFALCFSRQPTAERKGTEAGAMTLGGVDTRLHTTPMVYTTEALGNNGREDYWNVKIRKIYFRSDGALPTFVELTESQSNADYQSAIVDSGTTDTYLTKTLRKAFEQQFEAWTGRQYEIEAWSVTSEELNSFPTLVFQFESTQEDNSGIDPESTPGLTGPTFDPENPYDVLVAVPPSHYMEYDPSTNKYTPRVYLTKSSQTLGANTMMGHDILFDAVNSRIGWAESDCDYTGLLSAHGYDFPITGILQEGDTATNGPTPQPSDEETAEPTNSPSPEPSSEGTAAPTSSPSESAEVTAAPEGDGEGIDCNDVVDRSKTMNWDRAKNESMVAYCKAKKGTKDFLDFCDSAECYIPATIGVVLAACIGMCLCPALKCFCYYLFCCCCCCEKNTKSPTPDYDDYAGSELEMSGYMDEPEDDDDDDEEEASSSTGQRTKFRDRGRRNKNAEFNGDFKDFI
eukprot:scaffold821_cov122-Cylindrotheca_fusiformis.AAC.2